MRWIVLLILLAAGLWCFIRGPTIGAKPIDVYAKWHLDAIPNLGRDTMETRVVGGLHLTVEFEREGAVVNYRVLEQDESLRNVDAAMQRPLAQEGKYAIYSCYEPAIDGQCLWIRGCDRTRDNCTSSSTYNDSYEALEALDAFTRLIERINADKGYEREERIVGGPTLKVKFCLEGAKLTAQVLDQNEALRNLDKGIRQNDYEIRSFFSPRIHLGSSGTILYIRGRDSADDNEIAQAVFSEPDEAKAALSAFEKLIELVNDAEIKTMEVGPYTVWTMLVGDELLISKQRRDAA